MELIRNISFFQSFIFEMIYSAFYACGDSHGSFSDEPQTIFSAGMTFADPLSLVLYIPNPGQTLRKNPISSRKHAISA